MDTLFFSLLQVAVGSAASLPRALTDVEWEAMYAEASRQAVLGVAYGALEHLPAEQRPQGRMIRRWAVAAERIKARHDILAEQARRLVRFFAAEGYDACILKGTAAARYYPESLRTLRTLGDIDVWVHGEPREVIALCTKRRRGEFVYYHNLDFPVFRDTAVEVHYRPTWLFCPWRNARLQRWFRTLEARQRVEYNGYWVPTAEFDSVYQLLHLYKHIFEEGLGLRQLVDYYFVLQQAAPSAALLRAFGIERFAGAVLWLLHEVLALPADAMPCQPDEARGRQLLREVMAAGNFGKHDSRYRWSGSRTHYAIEKLRHNLVFLAAYPTEVMCEPCFRVWHWGWRKLRIKN